MTTPKTPEGWQLVPKEATEEMLRVGVHAFQHSYSQDDSLADWRAFFKAALLAAPTAPAGGEAPAEASDAQLMIVAQEMGLWCEAYTAPRESGVATELDITPEDVAEFNAASLKDIRAALKAAGLYTHPSADLRGAPMPPAFAAWMRDQAPPGTVISDPNWWAPRIWRAAIASLEAAISRKGKTE